MRELPEPPANGSLSFRYFSHGYQLVREGDVWAVLRDDDSRRLASLSRTETGWAVDPPEADGQWRGATHHEALETFLDDNEEWEFIGIAGR